MMIYMIYINDVKSLHTTRHWTRLCSIPDHIRNATDATNAFTTLNYLLYLISTRF